MITIDPIKKELILAFMKEAKRKNDINAGFNQDYKEAIGLVDVSICFEAFINALLPNEPKIYLKRIKFSFDYQDFFVENKLVFSNWVNALKKELDDNGSLVNMTPQSSSPTLPINDAEKLSEIVEVVYRVRSNLVHGSKELENNRNKILIENSFRFLYTLMDMIFKKEGILPE